VFSFQVSVDAGDGPETAVPSALDLTTRLKLYAKIDALKAHLNAISSGNEVATTGRAKTYASAIRALSAEAIGAKYGELVSELLKSKVKEVLRLDNRIRDLKDAIVANAELNPSQIDLLLIRLNQLSVGMPADQLAILESIKTALRHLRDQAVAEGKAVKVTEDDFFTDADEVMVEYQALILELGQFVSVSTIETLAPTADERKAISEKVGKGDIFISSDALGGRGDEVRKVFGLEFLPPPH
jgi:hypothetical protein